MMIYSILIPSLIFLHCSNSELVIRKVEMRNLRPKDIALIFDMTVYNDPTAKKEPLDFRIRCEECCISLPGNGTTCGTLYNRVGHCNITVSSYNKTGSKVRLSQMINFDTTINKQMIADSLKGFIKSFNVSDCPSPDLNPLMNCTPVDCEEKYFGQRSFFNTETNFCEPVPDCSKSNSDDVVYDYTINECVDLQRIICREHIIAMQKGEYDNNVWRPKHNVEAYANITHMPMEKFEISKKTTDPIHFDTTTPWTGVLQGFLIILGALILYICISCCTFCLMVVITKRASMSKNKV